VRAPLRSSSALVAVVVPCTITLSSPAAAEASPRAATTPAAWLATVVGTLATRTAPDASSTSTRSVKVPPTSTPTSIVSAMYPPRGRADCRAVRPERRGRASLVSSQVASRFVWKRAVDKGILRRRCQKGHRRSQGSQTHLLGVVWLAVEELHDRSKLLPVERSPLAGPVASRFDPIGLHLAR